MAGSEVSEASLLSEKCKRFGILGAGLVQDSLLTLKLAEAQKQTTSPGAKEEKAQKQTSRPVAKEEKAAAAVADTTREPSRPPVALKPSATVNGKTLSREEILAILAETVRVQGIVQQEVSVLARKLAKERGDKKKRKSLSFVDGHKKILELNLPREPLEDHGLTERTFQKLLVQYEEDEEVMASAQKLLHPAGKGDPERAASITMDQVIEIHRFMVTEMQKVLQEFLDLSQDVRRSFTGKGCETTAELLVSIAVEQQLQVRCEDVEQAVIRYEDTLQSDPEFTHYTEQLANMMQHLIGASQPRVQKAEFMQLLTHMGDSTKAAKAFAKKLYEDYRSKACTIVEAYQRFDEFSENAAKAMQEAEELPDLGQIELQLCYDEYRGDEEVRKAWEQSGVEMNLMMQASFAPMLAGRSPSSPSSHGEDKKGGKKLKSSEVVEMQELMVDEMKRMTEQIMRDSAGRPPWKAEIAIQLVQSLASAAVERRYGVTAEEMTMAGFQHTQSLQRNDRFARASEKQKEILTMLARLCGQEFPGPGSSQE